ncbi:MAG: thioredoxin [Chloroflexi bacterium]|nr:thioredoxin [Chloroflexota bacterium]
MSKEEIKMSKDTLHVTDATFQKEVLEATVPVLVDFWAPWCGPCRMVAPIIDELASDYNGRAVIAKLNTDENAETPGKYGIMGIPTMILFRDGQEVERLVGAHPKKAIAEKLDALLKPAA